MESDQLSPPPRPRPETLSGDEVVVPANPSLTANRYRRRNTTNVGGPQVARPSPPVSRPPPPLHPSTSLSPRQQQQQLKRQQQKLAQRLSVSTPVPLSLISPFADSTDPLPSLDVTSDADDPAPPEYSPESSSIPGNPFSFLPHLPSPFGMAGSGNAPPASTDSLDLPPSTHAPSSLRGSSPRPTRPFRGPRRTTELQADELLAITTGRRLSIKSKPLLELGGLPLASALDDAPTAEPANSSDSSSPFRSTPTLTSRRRETGSDGSAKGSRPTPWSPLGRLKERPRASSLLAMNTTGLLPQRKLSGKLKFSSNSSSRSHRSTNSDGVQSTVLRREKTIAGGETLRPLSPTLPSILPRSPAIPAPSQEAPRSLLRHGSKMPYYESVVEEASTGDVETITESSDDVLDAEYDVEEALLREIESMKDMEEAFTKDWEDRMKGATDVRQKGLVNLASQSANPRLGLNSLLSPRVSLENGRDSKIKRRASARGRRSRLSGRLSARKTKSRPVSGHSMTSDDGTRSTSTAESADVVPFDHLDKDGLVWFKRRGSDTLVIKGGMLQSVVARLTHASDNSLLDTVLLTYRTYIQQHELLDMLFLSYQAPIEGDTEEHVKTTKVTRLRLGNVVRRWLSNHFHDFHGNDELISKLSELLVTTFSVDHPSLGQSLERLLHEKQQGNLSNRPSEYIFHPHDLPPDSIVPKNDDFASFDPVEVARQLCLLEERVFKSIQPIECLNQAWNKHKEKSPNILAMIAFFNQFSNWVATYIIVQNSLKERVIAIKKFMRVAVTLFKYNNFNGCQEICAGLASSSVFRLKISWHKVSKDKRLVEEFAFLRRTVHTSKNYALYRAYLKKVDPPCLPYLGVYLTDLTFIEDGNSDFLHVPPAEVLAHYEKGHPNHAASEKVTTTNSVVNVEKMRKVAIVIQEIVLYQQKRYSFRKVDAIFNFFGEGLSYLSETECYRRSREIETKDAVAAYLKKKGI